jgi:hypothetical protein
MSLLAESVLSLADAAKLFPKIGNRQVCGSALRRWANVGVRGLKLESVLIGGAFCTSAEAVDRFLKALNNGSSVRKAVGAGEKLVVK